MSDLHKAYKFVNRLIDKAKAERDQKGYRENLGYDQGHKLTDYLNTLDLSYGQRFSVESRFDRLCNNL